MSPWIQELIEKALVVGIVTHGLLAVFSLCTLIERRVLAFMQFRLGPNRTGPQGILQQVADGIKLFFKEEFIPAGANKVLFILAPAVAVATAFMSTAVVTYGGALTVPAFSFLPEWLQGRVIELQIADLDVGILYLFALSSLGVYGVVMAGWASNNKYALVGGLRSSAQMFSYELALGLSWVPVILVTNSFRLPEIVAGQAGWFWNWNCFALFPAFLVYVVAGTAEANRTPFDLPEAETELVAGFHTEYSSMKFALLQMAEYVNMITISALGVNMFLGGANTGLPFLPPTAAYGLVGFLAFAAKVAGFLFFFFWLRGTLPRFRYDQLMHFGWKVLVPVAACFILVVAGVVAALA